MQVLRLVPTAPSRLVAVIAGGIPHRLRDCDTQCLYLRGALALAEAPAAAAVREGILAAAAEHLLSLDVEIRWQDIAAAEAGAPGFFMCQAISNFLPDRPGKTDHCVRRSSSYLADDECILALTCLRFWKGNVQLVHLVHCFLGVQRFLALL